MAKKSISTTQPCTDSPHPALLDWLRYLCAWLLYMYGFSKLAHMQFSVPPSVAKQPIGALTGYQLTWYYFGYSRSYASILGLIQVGGATLLLFRKTTFLGAAMMTPVVVNILLIDIFILVNDYGPEFMAIVILTSLLIILWHGRDRLVALFWVGQPREPARSRRTHLWIRCVILTFVLAAISVGVYSRLYRS